MKAARAWIGTPAYYSFFLGGATFLALAAIMRNEWTVAIIGGLSAVLAAWALRGAIRDERERAGTQRVVHFMRGYTAKHWNHGGDQ